MQISSRMAPTITKWLRTTSVTLGCKMQSAPGAGADRPDIPHRARRRGLQLGTPHPAVTARVAQLARRLYDRNSNGDHHVVADATGMGVTVAALIHARHHLRWLTGLSEGPEQRAYAYNGDGTPISSCPAWEHM